MSHASQTRLCRGLIVFAFSLITFNLNNFIKNLQKQLDIDIKSPFYRTEVSTFNSHDSAVSDLERLLGPLDPLRS